MEISCWVLFPSSKFSSVFSLFSEFSDSSSASLDLVRLEVGLGGGFMGFWDGLGVIWEDGVGEGDEASLVSSFIWVLIEVSSWLLRVSISDCWEVTLVLYFSMVFLADSRSFRRPIGLVKRAYLAG